jgi:hypothetical protein
VSRTGITESESRRAGHTVTVALPPEHSVSRTDPTVTARARGDRDHDGHGGKKSKLDHVNRDLAVISGGTGPRKKSGDTELIRTLGFGPLASRGRR